MKRFAAFTVVARLLLGGLFVYMGLAKAADPVAFLKLVREYHLVDNHILLNFIAAVLPWFEIFIGALLVLGIAVGGSSVLCLGMLIPFTVAVAQRAAAMHQAQGIPFCWIRFDCGCGGGEVLICRKLVENSALIGLALFLLLVRSPKASLREILFHGRTPEEHR